MNQNKHNPVSELQEEELTVLKTKNNTSSVKRCGVSVKAAT